MAIRVLSYVSPVFDNAILRDANGNLLQTHLNPEEIAALEWLAERNQVRRFLKCKKGRKTAVFQLLPPPEPPVAPSSSRATDCSLTDRDAKLFAQGFRTRTLRERWAGWGLFQ